MKFYDGSKRSSSSVPAFLATIAFFGVKRLRAISLWRWASGLGFGLLVLAMHLPNTLVAIHDSRGRSIGQWRFDPAMSGCTIGFVVVAVGCVLFGRRVATMIGFFMLAVGFIP